MPVPMRSPVPSAPPALAPPVVAVIAVCAVLEVGLTLAGGPSGGGGLRRVAMVYGAFWPGLLDGWAGVYPGQSVVMFLSYAFLHGGLMHMLFNMLILAHLSRETVDRVGPAGFLLFFAVTAAAGAAAYVLLSTGTEPMVGASGAVFGLFGATMFWDWQRRRAAGAPVQPVLRMGLGLVLMNVILWFLVQGYLAWEAHLGGFVAGWIAAWLATPTLAHRWRRHRG
jgi:membrane associated rhomboid family serine protease